MRITAFILGLIGGILGLFTAFLEFGFGGVGTAFQTHGSHLVMHLAAVTAAAGILGIIGSAMMWSTPKGGAWVCAVSVVVGLIGSSGFWALAGLFLFLATVFGFLAARPQPVTAPTQSSGPPIP